MELYSKQFLNPGDKYTDFQSAAVAILPVPYEGGISYGGGTAMGPDAVLEASYQLEFYDETLGCEPFRMGIATVMPPEVSNNSEKMQASIYDCARLLIRENKFVVMLGGDHSVTTGYYKALQEKFGQLSVIQLDAHADLRDTYQQDRLSHACVMARLKEFTKNILQIGIRSMSIEEAGIIEAEHLQVYTMADYRKPGFNIDTLIDNLPDPVYLTLDVDVFDWSVIRSTGTPEPGGFLWQEALDLLYKIFMKKNVVGFDVVEVAYNKHDQNSVFAVAKIIYKMLGFKLAYYLKKEITVWPEQPKGALF